MPLTILLGDHVLRLRVSCFGARGGAVALDDDTWALPADEGVGIFLLGEDGDDGAFLARVSSDERWEVEFYDEAWHQLALRDHAGSCDVLLKLEPPGAPIPAAGAEPGDEDALEVAPGAALWVTVRRTPPA